MTISMVTCALILGCILKVSFRLGGDFFVDLLLGLEVCGHPGTVPGPVETVAQAD